MHRQKANVAIFNGVNIGLVFSFKSDAGTSTENPIISSCALSFPVVSRQVANRSNLVYVMTTYVCDHQLHAIAAIALCSLVPNNWPSRFVGYHQVLSNYEKMGRVPCYVASIRAPSSSRLKSWRSEGLRWSTYCSKVTASETFQRAPGRYAPHWAYIKASFLYYFSFTDHGWC